MSAIGRISPNEDWTSAYLCCGDHVDNVRIEMGSMMVMARAARWGEISRGRSRVLEGQSEP